jgi:O-antigen ligase
MIKDNWLFGIGYSDFAEIMKNYKVPFDYKGLNDPHNTYLKVMCLSGIFGGMAFIYLWIRDLITKYLTFRHIQLKDLTPWTSGSIGSFFAVFALLVAGITQEYYHDAETAELWWFIAALGMIGVLKKRK